MLEIIKSTEEVILPFSVIETIFSQIEERIFSAKKQRKDSFTGQSDVNRKAMRLSPNGITNKGCNTKNIFKDKLKKLLNNNQKNRSGTGILNN